MSVVLFCLLIIGFMIPQHLSMPVQGAGMNSYAQNSYWAYPWGKSVTHKGVDIFARAGTPIHPATGGLVVYTGQIERGGNVVLVLGPKWRLHYYAHLQQIETRTLSVVGKGSEIGKADKSIQGWKKMFYLNPVTYLNESFAS